MAGEIAEKFVEEWLNWKGFLTIWQVPLHVNCDMDILACRIRNGKLNCQHYEVQIVDNPVGYSANRGKFCRRLPQKMKVVPVNLLNRNFRVKTLAEVKGDWNRMDCGICQMTD